MTLIAFRLECSLFLHSESYLFPYIAQIDTLCIVCFAFAMMTLSEGAQEVPPVVIECYGALSLASFH